MSYWTLAAHPDNYRVLDSVLEQDEDWWRTGDRHIARGDRVAIYKYKGREATRGVIAFGEVLTDPKVMEILAADEPYALDSPGRRKLPDLGPRVRVRYARAPRLPLWAEDGRRSVAAELAVARAQGGTAHHVTVEQWRRLLEEAGGVNWPSGMSTDVDAVQDDVRRLVRKPGSGQGFGLTAAERAVVEQWAMEVVGKDFTDRGWVVKDVSATSPYDLLCGQATGEQRRVEVKGTTGGPDAVILTRNEVIAAQADPETAALAIVHGITLDRNSRQASGGMLMLISPWNVDERALSPIAYRYQVPATSGDNRP
jgi:hypothetical protein